MSEEINEGNCVLSEDELLNIDTALFMMGGRTGTNDEKSKIYFENLYEKIAKLNDWYKNTHLEKIEAETDSEFAEVE